MLPEPQELARIGIPPLFMQSRLENYQPLSENQASFDAVQQNMHRILSGKPTNFVLSGEVGTGKTHLACAMAHEFLRNKGRVWFVSHLEFMRMIRTGRGHARDDELSEVRLIERAKLPRVLILDDVGVHSGMSWDRELIDEIVNYRYEHLNSTIMTTNLGIAALIEFLGKRAFDRMVQGREHFVLFTGASQRGMRHE